MLYVWTFFLLCQLHSLGVPAECANSQEQYFSSKCAAERRFEFLPLVALEVLFL